MADFFSKKIILWPETVKGVVPSPIAKAHTVTALSYSLTETQKTETNPLLGNGGQAPKTDFGSSDFAGNIELKYTPGVMPILANHIIGKATKTDAATGTWATTTLHVIGDMVKSVDGLKTLVCIAGGTTGVAEPSYVGLVDGDHITDGTVTWVYRDVVLKKYVGSLTSCLETLGLESQVETNCGGAPVVFKERYTGVFLNTIEFSKSGGAIIHKGSIPTVAVSRTDSAKAGFTDLTITTEVPIVDRAFGYDDLKVLIAGVEPDSANSFRLTINRNTGFEDGVKIGQKIDNTPIVSVDGELKVKFNPTDYAAVYNNPEKAVALQYTNLNGDYATFNFPAVENMRSPLEYATDKPIYMTTKLNATGNSVTATVNYVIVSATDW